MGAGLPAKASTRSQSCPRNPNRFINPDSSNPLGNNPASNGNARLPLPRRISRGGLLCCTALSNPAANSLAGVGLSWDAFARARMPSRSGNHGDYSLINCSASWPAFLAKLEAMAPG